MKKLKAYIIFLVVLNALLPPCLLANAGRTVFPKDQRTQRIIKQEAIIKEGNLLVERGLYNEAMAKFQEALDPSILNEDRDKGNAIYYIGRVYKLQGKYEESLKELQWSINLNTKGTGWIDEKLELEALIKARDTKSNQPIYERIKYLKKKYLSPEGFRGDADLIVPTIIRLYDHIGDYDQGITFVDEMRAYGLRQNKKVLSVDTAQEAFEKFQEFRNKRDAEWHEYKFAYEYLKIREAFEQDKKDGFKGCLDAKPGEACMGKATKALIQSDYFPW